MINPQITLNHKIVTHARRVSQRAMVGGLEDEVTQNA